MTCVCTVIVNFRSAELTVRATEAALRATAGLDHAPIYLVDNHSGDGSVDSLEQARVTHGWPGRVVIRDSGKNGGYGFGNNVGFRLGMMADPKSDYFYILNPDAFPDEDAVIELVRFAEANPHVGIIGSAARGPDGTPHCTAFRFPTIASELIEGCRLGFVAKAFANANVPLGVNIGERRVDWVGGMSVLIRREVLELAGLFDERYFLYFEETDLARRALSVGFETAYAPRSRVVHLGSAVTGIKDLTQPYPGFWYDSRRRYFAKHHGERYLLAADLARLGGELLHRARISLFPVDRPRKPRFIRDFARHMATEHWRHWRLLSGGRAVGA